MKKIFYLHMHLPTKTCKVGITNKMNSRLQWEANQWKRDVNDYKLIYKINTRHAPQIEKDCIQVIKHFNEYKVKNYYGSKVYAERFHYHRPLMKRIKQIVESYKNKPEPEYKKSEWELIDRYKWDSEKKNWYNSKGEKLTYDLTEEEKETMNMLKKQRLEREAALTSKKQ